MTSIEAQPLEMSRPRRIRSARSAEPATRFHSVLAGLLYVFFGVFLIWPVLQIVKTGFTRPDGSLTLNYFWLVFHDPVLVRGLLNAAGIAICVTLLTLVVSLPLAILSVRYSFPGRGILNGLLL